MLTTPHNTYPSSHEQKLLLYFGNRLIKHFKLKETYEKNGLHFEGPELTGDTLFHKLHLEQKIVAIYLAVKQLLDRRESYQCAEWKNSALECVYGWMLYEVCHEFMTPNAKCRSQIRGAYVHLIDSNFVLSEIDNTFSSWLNIIDRLASRIIWNDEKWKSFFVSHEKEELFVTPELLKAADSYFEDTLARNYPYG